MSVRPEAVRVIRARVDVDGLEATRLEFGAQVREALGRHIRVLRETHAEHARALVAYPALDLHQVRVRHVEPLLERIEDEVAVRFTRLQ